VIQKQEHKMCKTNMKTKYLLCLTYANMNMKRTWQGYGVRSCLKLVLNILKEMRGPTFICTLLQTNLKDVSIDDSMCASSK
jgi:hypothetical protein